jgi:hypothetical protein
MIQSLKILSHILLGILFLFYYPCCFPARSPFILARLLKREWRNYPFAVSACMILEAVNRLPNMSRFHGHCHRFQPLNSPLRTPARSAFSSLLLPSRPTWLALLDIESHPQGHVPPAFICSAEVGLKAPESGMTNKATPANLRFG